MMSAISMRKALAACLKTSGEEKSKELNGDQSPEVEEIDEEEEEEEDGIEIIGIPPEDIVHDVDDSDDSLAGMVTSEAALAQDEQLSDSSEDEGEIFPCKQCNTVFMTEEFLQNHMIRTHDDPEEVTSPNKRKNSENSSKKRKKKKVDEEATVISSDDDFNVDENEVIKDLEACLNEEEDVVVEGDIGRVKDVQEKEDWEDTVSDDSSDDEGEVFPCTNCDAVFMTTAFLEAHFEKSHSDSGNT